MNKKQTYTLTTAIIITITIASIAIYFYINEQNNKQIENQPITITDDTGYTLNIDTYPERIVSLAPSNTEILFAINAGEKVVGVTDYCKYPYDFSKWVEAGNMTSIGGSYNPATEPIIALEPDLILAFGGPGGSLDAIDKLRNLGYNVLTLNPVDADSVVEDVILLGKTTGNNEEATNLASNLQQRIEFVKNELVKAVTTPKVYCEVWNDPIMSVGPNSWISSLIGLAGGQNIFENASGTDYPTASSEEIITENPDVMIYPKSVNTPDFWGTLNDVKQRPGWNSINAIPRAQ